MESGNKSEEHPILLQTTVVNPSTGQPVYTVIKLPPGTTIENLTSMLQKKNAADMRPTLKKEVVALNQAVVVAAAAAAAAAAAKRENSEDSLEDSKATASEDSLDEEAHENASCVSDETKSDADRDNLATPPSSPGVATILSLIPESQRAGCHNGHKASILGGRYVLQKTNSRARLTGPFFCNACGLRFDWHSSARMHLNCHNRDFEACDKCQKRNSSDCCDWSSAERTGRPPRCNVCNKSFYLWKTYLAHQEKHKDKVKCPLCCKFFQSLHNVGRHYYDEHNGVPVVCSLCGNGYRAFKQYQTHVETIHMGGDDTKRSPPPSDDAINYSIDLPTLQQLDPSIRVFSSVERTCPVPNCGRIFSTQHTMQRHIYDVHCNELLPCALCGNAYRTYTQFEHHCELFHGENFRVELPVGEISVPVKRKRERASSDSEAVPLPPSKRPLSREVPEEVSSPESSSPDDEPLDMTVVKQEPSVDVILPD